MNRPRTPSLNTLRAFEAAARHGSFAAAAGELNVTAAAVSHRVKELEGSLGVALFVRQPRGVELTEIGRRYRDSVASAFQIIERATAGIDRGAVDGPLVVSTPHSFAQLWLAPRLERLMRRFPGLELSLVGDSRLADLRNGQADLGVRFGSGGYPGLQAEYLMGDAVTVLAPIQAVRARADSRPRALMQSMPLLEDMGIAAGEPWNGWSPWLREAGLRPQGLQTIRLSDSSMTLAACQRGLGLCVGRLSVSLELLQERRVQALFPWRSTEYGYYLVSRSAEQDNPRVMAFRRWLLAEIDTYVAQVKSTLAVELGRPVPE
ncbi:LysR substrate-binding domain-containing protein [Zobellella maritima]|uniref:LysR substrate-binding domain-containing protein n=1 Tax=Zobellella maritima TaxID=2059725 RepID=UPI000E30AF8A|nr:LysR substrate-binding domain-containing protein [Zobellella maritima]